MPLNAIILAAGYGTRLGDLGKKYAKAFLPIGRRPAIDILISSINVPEIQTIYVIHNGRWSSAFRRWKDSIVDQGGRNARLPYIKLFNDNTFEDGERLGAIADLEFVLDRIGDDSRDFILVPVDSLFDWPICRLLEPAHIMDPASAWLSVREVSAEDAKELGRVEINPDTLQITSFIEKNSESDIRTVWLGPALFTSACGTLVKKYCDEQRRLGLKPDSLGEFINWLLDKVTVRGVVIKEGNCIDVGSLRNYHYACVLLGGSIRNG
jgi:glucose-1-phosphate thymidylyltransferase